MSELPRIKYRTYRSGDGYTILVGKSADDNDRLTLELGEPEDLWLHVNGCPGSHVLVKKLAERDGYPRATVEQAAQLAGWFSKARAAAKVAVHATLRRNVWKEAHQPPGQVFLRTWEEIKVRPELCLEESGPTSALA